MNSDFGGDSDAENALPLEEVRRPSAVSLRNRDKNQPGPSTTTFLSKDIIHYFRNSDDSVADPDFSLKKI